MQFSIDVVVRTGQAQAGIKKTQAGLAGLTGQSNLLRGAITRAVAAFGGFTVVSRSIRVVADFEQSLATIQAVTRSTADEMERFSTVAQELGRTTRFTASQAADALVLLSRAGFTVQESTTAVAGTLRLAQAAGVDLATATDITASSLRGFRLAAEETSRIVDVLALASSRSNTTVTDLGQGLKFVAPIATGLGVSFERTSAAMGVLSDAGLQASMAGTGLRRVLAGLETPTRAAEEILAQLGVTADEIQVSQVGLVTALERLRDAGVDTGQALELFGQRGGPAFEVLVSNIPRLRRLTDVLSDAEGTADRMAETMDDTLIGAAKRALSAVQGLILSFDNAVGAGTALRTSLEGIADAFNLVSDALGAQVAAAEAERALVPVGDAIVRLQGQIRSLEAVGEQQGFLSDSQRARLDQLRASLDALREGYRQETIAVKEAAAAETEAAARRELAAEQTREDAEAAIDPIEEQTRALREQNELLGITIEEGEAAAAVKAIELDLTRELGEAEKERIAAALPGIRMLIEEQERLNQVLDDRGAATGTDDTDEQLERTRRQVDFILARLGAQEQLALQTDELNRRFQEGDVSAEEFGRALEQLQLRGLEASTALGDGFERAFLKIAQEARDLASVAEAAVNAFADNATDALVDFAETGTFNIRQFADSFLSDLTRILARLLVVQAITAGAGAFGISLPGFQSGGRVRAGEPIIVGEGGRPEVFVPPSGGTIHPDARAFMSQQQAPAPAVTVVNVASEDEVPNAIAGGSADSAIINVLARNRDKVKQVVG